MGKTNQQGFYLIESASYGTGTTFLADPMKDFYMYRALKFVRNNADYAQLPDFSLTPKATLELWVNSAGPDGEQCLISKTWPGNDFRLLLTPNGNNNEIKFYLNGQQHNFGTLGVGYQLLAFTIDSSGLNRTVTAYKNGVSLGSHTFTGVSGSWSDPNSFWILGARSDGMGLTDYLGGLIDEVAVYDTTLSAATILGHFQAPRDMQAKGLRVYFPLDEGNGNRLNNAGSVLLPFGTNFGAEWSPFAARQRATPHEFTPVTRQVTLNPSVTSVDQVDFIDRSTIPVSGFVRYKNTDCFAKNVEILVNGASFNPKIFTDSTGKFVVEFDPGTTATLTPVFEDHNFIPAFWDVTNVINPIAGILFNDVTTRKVKGKVAGGLCKKSVIKAPPGMGQGTVCVVKVRSTDGCLERQIIIDNQEGDYEFAELPPLESLTVAVVEHSDPDIKSAFQVLGGSTVNLTKTDTIIDFIYFAPPEVIINSGLDTVMGCSPQTIVLDKGELVSLNISLVERYVPIVDPMNPMVIFDDGLCPLDTANFRIINGFSDETLDTAMSGGMLKYKFRVGDPNPSPPFIKTLQILGTSLAGREGSLTKQAVVTGIRNKENTFTTLLPEMPSVVLRDPPGDGSSAFLEKNTKVCKTYAASFEYEVGGGGGIEFHLGGNVEVAIGIGVATIMNAGPIFDIGAEFQVTYQKVTDSTFQTCMSVNEKLSTSDGDLIVGGANGADIYMGEAINLIFGFADMVSFDTCTPSVKQILNVEPDTFATVFMYSEFHIVNNV
ncbi:MAG: LamG domain-containing protein, partial [Saprospiraceae bacterium]|nr:LamG domain-containing protein [Saprospiraceae bacterium]